MCFVLRSPGKTSRRRAVGKWETRRVFQGGAAAVFSRACGPRRKRVRCQVPKTAVGPGLVVFAPPGRDLAPRVKQVVEPADVQELVPHSAVKTLQPAVLHRSARLDVKGLNLVLHAPSQKVPAGQLRAVVTANPLRQAALSCDRLQHPRDPRAGEAGVHLQRQALSRERIGHAQHADGAAAFHPVGNKIQCPLLVRRSPRRQRLPHACAVLALLPPNRQPRGTIDAVYPLVVHRIPVSPQQHMQAPIAKARLLPRQGRQARPQRLIRSPGRIAKGPHRHLQQFTPSPLAEGILPLQLLDSCLPRYELQP